ncbi:MAG: IPT/TIG domain-containing protein, partial [Bacteriovorax sp.]|nr:IPT/TIG domain-containing protein [Bacteriovorax sp.]
MRIQVIGFSLFLNQIKLFFKAPILFSLFFALILVSCKKSAVNDQSGQITALSPSTGVTAGGTLVSIKGLNLGSTLSVKIGNKACEISSISSEEINCTTPSNATGSYDVLVAVNKIQTFRLSAGFSYLPDPTITSISPNNGLSSGATLVTIVGKEFKEGAIVDFGGANCENVEVISSTTLTCTTTLHYGGTVDVTITNTNNQSGTSVAAFTYIAPPTVSHISPSAGALSGSTTITLTGSNFLTGITVNLGGGNCSDVRILSQNSLTCMTPAHAAGSVSVTVTNSDSQSQTVAGLYTYQAAPTLTSVSPNEGPLGGNTSVILTGTNFSFGAIAKFNAKPCTNQLILSTTSISCTTPLQFFTGAFDITVTNLDNQVATYSSAFTYNNPPTITSISPNSGYAIGGTAITITGTGFRSGASVDLGGVACTVTLLSATSITCTTAAHA